MNDDRDRLDEAIAAYYARGREAARLTTGAHGQLELARTRELLERFLPPPPARVLDVGGGAGIHALWLAEAGYDVTLIDPVGLHVDQAREAAAAAPRAFVCELGDARRLEHADDTADAVLLLGPLYHIPDRHDRLAAWREARRVTKRRGFVAAAAIARFASLLDGLTRGFLVDPEFRAIVETDLTTGQHRNPERRAGWFTTGYFHHPDELVDEMREAGLHPLEVFGVEGPGGWLPDLDERWAEPERREAVLFAARALEREPSMLGLGSHLLALGRV